MPKTTIVEDIQALKERFETEFGLSPGISVFIHGVYNPDLKGMKLMQKAIDLIIANDLDQRPAVKESDNGTRWIALSLPRGEGGLMQITLFE